jgi:hypothetical protein
MTAAGGVPVRSGEDTGGWHQPLARLTVRPAAGAALARAHLEYREAHRAPEADKPRWITDPAVLRRVRDALAPGGPR